MQVRVVSTVVYVQRLKPEAGRVCWQGNSGNADVCVQKADGVVQVGCTTGTEDVVLWQITGAVH